jgi:hypothetical protein
LVIQNDSKNVLIVEIFSINLQLKNEMLRLLKNVLLLEFLKMDINFLDLDNYLKEIFKCLHNIVKILYALHNLGIHYTRF